MLWLRRAIILIPVISFISAALLLSCGGGGSSTSTTATPLSVMSLRICEGSPPTMTPTPVPTKGSPTPKITPTPECNPPSGVPTVATGSPIQFNAQGTYSQSVNGHKIYRDVTNDLSLSWGIQPPGVLTLTNPGEFFGLTNGCACITALISNVLSCPVTVQVGSPATPCGLTPPNQICPTPTTTPSNGSTPVALCPGPTVTPSPG